MIRWFGRILGGILDVLDDHWDLIRFFLLLAIVVGIFIRYAIIVPSNEDTVWWDSYKMEHNCELKVINKRSGNTWACSNGISVVR